MEKTLSVSIAAYNVEKYLKKTLSSLVTDRSFERIEVIIVNDGSTDETLTIARNFQKEYGESIIVINKENGGYGSTINCAIKIASGKYFKQLDGDDWFENCNIEDFLDYLDLSQSDLILSPFNKYFEVSGTVQLVDDNARIAREQTLISEVSFGETLAMHELAIKTELLRNNNINITENCFYTDNEYTFFPLIIAKTISRFDKPIYVYRIGREGQSVSLEGARKHYKDTMKVAYSIISGFEKANELNNKEIIWKKIKNVVDAVYTYYLCSNDVNAKADLMKFDNDLKENHYLVYRETMKIKKIYFLRKSSFMMFDLLGNKLSKGWK